MYTTQVVIQFCNHVVALYVQAFTINIVLKYEWVYDKIPYLFSLPFTISAPPLILRFSIVTTLEILYENPPLKTKNNFL